MIKIKIPSESKAQLMAFKCLDYSMLDAGILSPYISYGILQFIIASEP
jgi:hypothetical protein